jgi:nitrate reductase gamma subunit
MNNLLFVALPYVAGTLAILGGLYRYFTHRFSYSSLSSQLLENRVLFWGAVPWHYGIIPILLAHLTVALFPVAATTVLGDPVRRLALEILGMALALFALAGLLALIVRRMPRRSLPRAVTSPMDWILLAVLLLQVASGFSVALFQRWGSMWYMGTAVPWFWSIARLRPDPSTVAVMPTLVQFHFVTGFLIILLFPFSRLVHLVTVPVTYLWRPYQVVFWNRRPGALPRGPEPRSLGAAAARPARTEVERRRFLNRLSITLAGVAGLVVAAPSVALLLGLRKVESSWRPIGALDQFQPGTTTLVAFTDPSPLPWAGVTARTAAWLRREADDRFLAFSVNCTHLGCPVRWLPDADVFMCPCHGGVFYHDGRVASGPPGRPLSQYPARVHNGVVEILASPLPIT